MVAILATKCLPLCPPSLHGFERQLSPTARSIPLFFTTHSQKRMQEIRKTQDVELLSVTENHGICDLALNDWRKGIMVFCIS